MQLRRSLGALAGLATAVAVLAVTASPAFADSGSFVVYADTVTNQGCVQTNVFHRGLEGIVWRVNVLQNGQQDKNATVTIEVKGGQTFKAPYNTHDGFYTGFWPLPINQATGTIQYTVTATDGSQTATYQPQFMVAPSELMIVPATYTVTAKVGTGKATATSIAKSVKAMPVSAAVNLVASSEGKTTLTPMTAGVVKAQIGLEGNINAQGAQIVVKTVALHYQASTKTWVGSIPKAGLKPGLYVVVVNAQDQVSPPNTGTGTSLAFTVQ